MDIFTFFGTECEEVIIRLDETGEEILKAIPKDQILKIKLEVDNNPPPCFATQIRYLLQPIPFAVRDFVLPDLFADKMHAIIFAEDGKAGLRGETGMISFGMPLTIPSCTYTILNSECVRPEIGEKMHFCHRRGLKIC